MIDIPLGSNPFLTVTADELDNNIAEATERLKSMKDTQNWRKEHHCCVKCGDKLPLGYTSLVCPYCKKNHIFDIT